MPASPSMTTAAGVPLAGLGDRFAEPRQFGAPGRTVGIPAGMPHAESSDGAGNRKSLRDAGSWRAAFWVERRTLNRHQRVITV